MTVRSVLKHPEFESKPHGAAWDIWVKFGCKLAANGALMRTAVLGAPFFWDEKQVIKQTLQATKVTHADPRCCVSSIIVTNLISRLLKGNTQDILPDLDDGTKEEILRWMQSGNPDNQGLNIDSEDPPHVINAYSTDENIASKRSNLHKYLMRHNDQSKQKSREIAQIPDNSPPGIDKFGADPVILKFTRSVVERYKFIANSILVGPDELDYLSNFKVDAGEKALLEYCFPESLEALKLDESSTIGYVYKCLGSALYCFTRKLNQQPSESEAFKTIITELILEAG